MSDDRYAPIFDKIAEVVKALAPKDTHEDIDAAKASVLDEFDVFVRSGNRTDYRRDELAATSGKMEKLIDGRDGWAHTYSTMKGRRVDDLLYTCLNHISTFVFPPTAREDKKKDGSPKMTSRAAERERWIQSLGYTKAEVGKGRLAIFRPYRVACPPCHMKENARCRALGCKGPCVPRPRGTF